MTALHTSETLSAVQRDAAEYLEHGWCLVPIHAGSKQPQKDDWSQRKNCVSSSDQLAQIQGNVGVAHAYSRTTVLDIDNLEETRTRLAPHGIDLDELLNAEDAVQIHSGRDNRGKLLYRLPEGCWPLRTKQIEDKQGNMVYELRCATKDGRTVQDVLPPSIHPDTRAPYDWGGKGNWRNLPVLPEPLLTLWHSLLTPARASTAPELGNRPVDRAEVESALAAIDPDCAYPTWVRIGMGLRWASEDWGLDAWDAWSEKGEKYLGRDELEAKWDTFDPDGGVTLGTLFHLAKQAGWVRQSNLGPFMLTDDGVYHNSLDAKGVPVKTWVCKRLEVVAEGRDPNSSNWGKLVRFADPDGVTHRVLIPWAQLSGSGDEVRGMLLKEGLQINTHLRGRQLFIEYLQRAQPSSRVRTVENIGWHGDVFVLPDRAFGEADEEMVLQGTMAGDRRFSPAGTLEEWQEHVARPCQGNSRLILALCAAFAAPLLVPLKVGSGGFHLRGQTSAGKSTALRVGASVWGRAEVGKAGFMQNWRSTDNALENIAAMHTDVLLPLDEIKQADSRKIGESAYMLGNGQTKARSHRSGETNREGRSFQTLVFSTGEASLADLIRESKQRVYGGQEARLLDIPAEAGRNLGVFEDLHGAATGQVFADQLSAASVRYYGVAGRAFLEQLVPRIDDVKPWVRERMDTFKRAVLGDGNHTGDVRRVAERFALVAAAGELAIELGIHPWSPNTAAGGVAICFRAWLTNRGGGRADMEELLSQIRYVVERGGTWRFPNFDDADKAPGAAGWIEGEKFLVVKREVFKQEMCTGHNLLDACNLLQEAGILFCKAKGRHQVQKRDKTRNGGPLDRFYVLDRDRLFGIDPNVDPDEEEAEEQTLAAATTGVEDAELKEIKQLLANELITYKETLDLDGVYTRPAPLHENQRLREPGGFHLPKRHPSVRPQTRAEPTRGATQSTPPGSCTVIPPGVPPRLC